jgi:hypothetical protein
MAFTNLVLRYTTPAGEFAIERFLWSYRLTVKLAETDGRAVPHRYRGSKREVFDLASERVRIDMEEGRLPPWLAEHVTALLTITERRP